MQPTHDRFDPRRRRLFAGGASVVLSSLLAKPVLGATPYNCTVSGQLSGNTSSHGADQVCSSVGKSPDYWITNLGDWPAAYAPGVMPQAGTCSGDATATLFKSVTVQGLSFADAYNYNCTTGALVEPAPSGTSPLTLLQVLALDTVGNPAVGSPAAILGSTTVATLLSAAKIGTDFPLAAVDVIDMFNHVYLGGSYQVKTGVYWGASDVISYFKSLYG